MAKVERIYEGKIKYVSLKGGGHVPVSDPSCDSRFPRDQKGNFSLAKARELGKVLAGVKSSS